MARLAAIARLAVFFAFAVARPASSADCFLPHLTLSTQLQVDRFQQRHGPCIELEGDLRISGPGIVSLAGLGAIVRIDGDLVVDSNPALRSLAGLGALAHVGGSLRIRADDALATLDGLSSLAEVGASLEVERNPALLALTGLPLLERVGNLVIVEDDALHDLAGLASLDAVAGDISVFGNDALASLDGLEGIVMLHGALNVSDDARLASLDGLSSLQQVGSLLIDSLPLLETLDDLRSLTRVTVEVGLSRNPRLRSLAALSGIEDVLGLRIEDDDALTTLHGLEALRQVGFEGVTIAANDSLRDFDGLGSLATIDGNLDVGSSDPAVANRVLSSLDGLEALASVHQLVTIDHNPLLADVDALASLTSAGGLSVVSNPRLADCGGLSRLLDAIDDPPAGPGTTSSGTPDVGGILGIGGNAPGCNSVAEILASPPDTPCHPDDWTACLVDGRFRVRADLWDFSNGPVGPGERHRAVVQTYQAVRGETDLSASFYAFEEGNVELFVKVLDACSLASPAFWVFTAGATTAEAEIEVLDTWTGRKHRVFNPRGSVFATTAATDAFATCDAPSP